MSTFENPSDSQLMQFAQRIAEGVQAHRVPSLGTFVPRYLIKDVYDMIHLPHIKRIMSLANFKRYLLLAHQRGFIELSRLDLPQSLWEGSGPMIRPVKRAQDDYTASEIRHLTSTYHLLRV